LLSATRCDTNVLSLVGAVLALSMTLRLGTAEDETLRLADVAGKYWMSDGRDRRWTVTVRKDGTFTSTRLVGDRVEDVRQPRDGVASVSNGTLALVVPPGNEMYLLDPVKLGKRLYLLPSRGQLDFCIALAEGREPRPSDVGDVLLRVGDERVRFPRA
jgi:hypothetical protein